ncbi:MAG: DUF342 domain-containing protein [Candidatus Caldatribacterium sp.]|nr:DUF342 domain-containing protein [Candidatus Caldatribacterium sp.]
MENEGREKRPLDGLERDGFFQLLVPTDGMRAEIVVKKPLSSEDLAPYEELEEYLRRKGIVFGLTEEAKTQGKLLLTSSGHHLVAEGVRPQRGKDGEVRYLFEEEVRRDFVEEPESQKDLFGILRIPEVHAGDVLAEVLPPGEGIPGKNVFGKEVPAPPGRPAKIRAGKNVEVLEDGRIAVAKVSGRPVVVGRTLSVLPLFEIDGDVGPATGDVRFVGSVVIRGTVRSGFTVESEGDVEVWEGIEAATVRAQGNVRIRGGFFGGEKGLVEAGGSVFAKVIESATVKAQEDIIVEEAVLHSFLSAGRNIIVRGRKGILAGGVARAGNLVWVKVLGSPMGTRTEVSVGIDPEIQEEYRRIRENLKKVREVLQEAEKVFQLAWRKQKSGACLEPKLLEAVKKAKESYELAREQEKIYTERLAEIEEIFEKHEGKVLVEEKVYPQVRITIGRSTYIVRDEIVYASFYEKDKDVVIGSFERPRVKER